MKVREIWVCWEDDHYYFTDNPPICEITESRDDYVSGGGGSCPSYRCHLVSAQEVFELIEAPEDP